MNCKYKYYAKVEQKTINGINHLIIVDSNKAEFIGALLPILLQHLEPDFWSDLYNVVNITTLVHNQQYNIRRKLWTIEIKWNEAAHDKKPYFLERGCKNMKK